MVYANFFGEDKQVKFCAWAIASRKEYSSSLEFAEGAMSEQGFVSGIIIGVLATAFATFLWFLIRQWLDMINGFNQPQKIIHLTDKTPADVLRDGHRARQNIALLVIFIALLVWVRLPGEKSQNTGSMLRQVAKVLLEIVELLIMILHMLRELLSNFL
jgi:hypothetical protein